MTFLRKLTAASLAATLVASAYADDLVPPPWRGLAGTTVQEWEYYTPAVPLAPDGDTWGGGHEVNPYASAANPLVMDLTVGAFHEIDFTPSGGGPRVGVYALAPGTAGPTGLGHRIPNTGVTHHRKRVHAQVTWWNAFGPPEVHLSTPGATFGPMVLHGTTTLSDGWFHSVFTGELPFCPDYEFVDILNFTPGEMYIDQFVVDTHCVPEPATMTLVGTGIVALLAKRRRKA